MERVFLLIFPVFLLLGGCGNNGPVTAETYETNPQYTHGYVLFFGDYYKDVNIESNILSMSLFTESLRVENSMLTGVGQYLNIEEFCLAPVDTMIPIGIYTINNSREPMTALPGEIPEEYPYTIIGANITYQEENSITYMLIENGTFYVESIENDSIYSISFNFTTSSGMELEGNFNGVLPHYNAQRKSPVELETQGILPKNLQKQ